MDIKNKVLPGYEPVLEPLEPEPEVIAYQPQVQIAEVGPLSSSGQAPSTGSDQAPSTGSDQATNQESIDREMIREIIQEILTQEQAQLPPL